jgi:hypothetical protein
MKQTRVFTIVSVSLIVCLLMVMRVSAASDWIYGTVASAPSSVTYNGATMSLFSFNVSSSSNPTITGTILVVTILAAPQMSQTLNYSGSLITDISDPMLVGAFLASSINGVTFNGTGILTQVLNAFVTFGNILTTEVVQIVQMTMGYSLTPLYASLLLLAVLSGFFMFFGKHFPWYVDILGFVVFISLILSAAVGTGLLSLAGL